MPELGSDPFEQERNGRKPPAAETDEETKQRLQWMQHRREGSFRDPALHKKLSR